MASTSLGRTSIASKRGPSGERDPYVNPIRLSIIIPVCNGLDRLDAALQRLFQNVTDRTDVEVIVVDNRSTEDIPSLEKKYPIRLLAEHEKPGPAAARNKGLRIARGDVICFTDADCMPLADWPLPIVSVMQELQADLVAGAIDFELEPVPEIAPIVDSISYLQQKSAAIERAVAFTANLCVRREVLDRVGGFDDRLENSCEDIDLCQRAGAAGYVLRYSDRLRVSHPARDFRELTRKAFRIGLGKGQGLRRTQSKSLLQRLNGVLRSPQLRVALGFGLTKALNARGLPCGASTRLRVVLCANFLLLVNIIGAGWSLVSRWRRAMGFSPKSMPMAQALQPSLTGKQ